MTVEDPAVALARVDGRLVGIESQLSDIKQSMATQEGSRALIDGIRRLERALSDERAERIAAVTKVEARLQLVEDRQEARKFQFGIAIALGVLGIIFGLAQNVLGGVIGL